MEVASFSMSRVLLSGFDLLDQHRIRLADIEDEILLLVREQTADHIVGGNVVGTGDADQKHHPLHVRDKMQFPGLGINIAGQNIVQHHILDEIGLVELFIVILLDALQTDGQHGSKLFCRLVRPFHKDSVIVVLGTRKLVVSAAIAHEGIAGGQTLCRESLAHLADLAQLGTGNDRTGLVHDTNHTVHCVLHLVYHILEYPVCHNSLS